MKKWIALLLTLLIISSLAACGSKESASEAPVVSTPSEAPAETPAVEEPAEEPAPAAEVKTYNIGDIIEHDLFTMTLDSMQILDEYSYSTGEYSSMSLYVEEGYKLLLVKGHFENKGTSAISSHDFDYTVLVNGTYEADGIDVQLQFQRDKYFELDAYTDKDYVLYINIPEKLAQQFETATFSLACKRDLSQITTHWNSDGTVTTDAELIYEITGTK